MKTIILALSTISTLAFADTKSVCDGSITTTTTTTTHCQPVPSCPMKVKRKVVKKKPAPKKAEPKVVTKVETKVVYVPVTIQPVQVPVKVEKEEEKEPWIVYGLHTAVGVGIRDPYTSALVGVRVKVPAIHLGLEVYDAFDYGVAAQLMAYTYQGKVVAHHIDVGMLGFQGSDHLSTQDIPRKLDVTLGTGLEIRLVRHLALTTDWRMSFPDPGFIASHNSTVKDAAGNTVYGSDGRYVSNSRAIGNSLTQSQLLIGLLLRNW